MILLMMMILHSKFNVMYNEMERNLKSTQDDIKRKILPDNFFLQKYITSMGFMIIGYIIICV